MDRAIPKELSHLHVDPRGYPIPYFVPIIEGRPAFNMLDEHKQHLCIDNKICMICGRKLNKDFNYVITGPVGYQNRTVTDPPMHEVCATYAVRTCPHIYFEKTHRIVDGTNPLAMRDKPQEIRIIRIDKWSSIRVLGKRYVKFRPVSYKAYQYVDGVLNIPQQ